MDFLEKVQRPSATLGPDEEADRYGGLLDRYHSRPHREKEYFAHAYAKRLREHLEAIRAIPFDRELDRGQIKQDGLRLEDFCLSQS